MNIKMLKAAATGLVLSVSSLANAGLIIMDEDTEYIGLLTDWGSGLNFVAAWELWEKTSQPHQQLYFLSTENQPLSKQDFIK